MKTESGKAETELSYKKHTGTFIQIPTNLIIWCKQFYPTIIIFEKSNGIGFIPQEEVFRLSILDEVKFPVTMQCTQNYA